MEIGFFVLLIILAFASEQKEIEAENVAKSKQKIVRIGESSAEIFEEAQHVKKNEKTSKYVGVTYNQNHSNWRAIRCSKNDYTMFYNGPYKNEKRAAYASDALARELMENGELGHKLNFPDRDNYMYTYVHPEEMKTSEYIGVTYSKRDESWKAQRWSRTEKTMIHFGTYKDEERAAHASDTLARKLRAEGEENHVLNFPDDHTEVSPEEMKTSSNYIGVSYKKSERKWRAQRRSKNEKKMFYNGGYKYEETAAHASDNLAKKLMANGELGHKLNFPDNHKEICPEEVETSKYFGVSYNKRDNRWLAQRRSKFEKKMIHFGTYKDRDSAAHGSDTLARELMANGERGHKLNFPEQQRNKRKRSEEENFGILNNYTGSQNK